MTETQSRPRIGITPDINDLAAPETEYVIRRNYADAVLRAGGLPFLLPYNDENQNYLAALDGLLITGGLFDIDPALYGQAARKAYVLKPARTAFEKALVDGALAVGMPILGICNGMQLLAVCLGGQLVQDIPSEMPDALEHRPARPATNPQHDIRIIDPSPALVGIGAGDYPVNSVHHQAVLPSAAYRAIAVAPDGVIEAIEAVGHGFAVGVQWHPEYAISAIDDAPLRGLVAAASDYARRRSEPSHA